MARVREEIRCKDIFSKLKTVYLHPLHVFYPCTLRMGESTKQSELLLGTVLEIVIDNLSNYTWLYLLFTQMKQAAAKYYYLFEINSGERNFGLWRCKTDLVK